ncbi:hypothetical protein H6504_00160 [Candidatus Woesearchaeota archaeon]|nr:hypothetical protein [Candidatus Woesearchaeota archaeon]
MKHVFSKAFFLVVVLVGLYMAQDFFIEPTGQAISPVIPSEIGPRTEVYFCPQDDCEAVFTRIISKHIKIDCALHDLRLDSIIDVLVEKNARVVVDDRYISYVQSRIDMLKFDTTSQITHNKFCVMDGEVVITGSFNPTENGAEFNDNNIVVVHSKTLAKNYQDEFDELWSGVYSGGARVSNPKVVINGQLYENYFCPEDCISRGSGFTPGRERVIELIEQADSSVYFMTFSFTDDEIGDALIDASRRGVEVKGVFEKRQLSEYSEYDRLEAAGINVSSDHNKQSMHHKVFIIDENIVITGSTNPSNNGFTRNDENILIIHDAWIAAQFVDAFEELY